MRAPSSCTASARIAAVLALAIATACSGGAHPAPRAPAPPPPPATDALLALAPAGTRVAVVVSAHGLTMLTAAHARLRALAGRDPWARDRLAGFEQELADELDLPGLDLAALGLTDQAGFAWFELADGHSVSIWPVADRATFVDTFDGDQHTDRETIRLGGRALYCGAVGAVHACSDDPALVAKLGTGSLAGRPARAGARGDVEVLVLPAAGATTPTALVNVGLERGQLALSLWTDVLTAADGPAPVQLAAEDASGWVAVAIPRSALEESLSAFPQARAALAALAGPLTVRVPSGIADVDLRLPLARPAVIRALMTGCAARPRFADIMFMPDGDGCRLTTVGAVRLELVAWVDGDTLRVSRTRTPVAAASGPGPTAAGRALLARPWTGVAWGRGLVIPKFDPHAMPIAGMGPIIAALLGETTELGLGVQVGPDGTTAEAMVRTIETNPPEVVDALTALLLRAGDGEPIADAVRALAAAHPTAPLADDVAAGQEGLLPPLSAGALVAGLTWPRWQRSREGRGTPDAITERGKTIRLRASVTDRALVKHVLIGWKGHGRSVSTRSQDEAARLAWTLADELERDPGRIDALMRQYSEDPGSATSGRAYTVTPDAGLIAPFKDVGLRLHTGEVGIVESDFGYHVMLRIEPPPPDPLESADILARAPATETVYVQDILIGWKDTPATATGLAAPQAAARTKAEADTLASALLARARAGEDMTALMQRYSEDTGSKDTGKAYAVSADSRMVLSFRDLSLRLRLGEVGLVQTDFGWHIIKRVAPPAPPAPPLPPAPDKLESRAILARAPVTEHAVVEHILLGWTEVNSSDPRAVARTRKQLEALVAQTLRRLRKGARFEALMAELSEDPGSAATGMTYDVTPDAGLVEPFKRVSLRLKVGEVGVVRSQFGIHLVKRVE